MRRTLSTAIVLGLLAASGPVASSHEPVDDHPVNHPPHPIHGDVVLVDRDGDGEETARLEDVHSHDHDETRTPLERDVSCEFFDSIPSPELAYFWLNSTDETEKSLIAGENFIDVENPTRKVTWGQGTWDVAMRVEDECGERVWTNFTVSVVPDATPLVATGFEDGLSSAWTTTGLWQVTDACSTDLEGAQLAFTQEPGVVREDCNYDRAERPLDRGEATVAVDLSEGREQGTWHRLAVGFDHRFDVQDRTPLQIERPPALTERDVMRFQVSRDDGQTWTTLASWDDDTPDRAQGIYNWTLETDPASASGDELLLRWTFETRGPLANDARGWFVDDLTVRGLS